MQGFRQVLCLGWEVVMQAGLPPQLGHQQEPLFLPHHAQVHVSLSWKRLLLFPICIENALRSLS